jgi:hypothetical protein
VVELRPQLARYELGFGRALAAFGVVLLQSLRKEK